MSTKYLIKTGHETKWMTIGEAAPVLDSGLAPSSIVGKTWPEGEPVRDTTDEEVRALNNAADEYGFNK